jgi:hypothetical protein
VDYTLNRRHLAKADRRVQLVRDKLSRMLSDVVGMVPGGRTDSGTASPVLAAAVKGRTWRLARGGCRSLLLDVRSLRWPRVAVPGARPVVSAVSTVLAASAAQGLGKGPKCSS